MKTNIFLTYYTVKLLCYAMRCYSVYYLPCGSGDSLKLHANHPFSTKDRDNDDGSERCAQVNKGAWWYTQCHQSNLNGEYLSRPRTSFNYGIQWESWHGDYYSLKKVTMKLKP